MSESPQSSYDDQADPQMERESEGASDETEDQSQDGFLKHAFLQLLSIIIEVLLS